MVTTADSNVSSRARLHAGRKVQYYPTAAEEATLGAGPYPGTINLVNRDGSVDISMLLPGGSAVAEGNIASALPTAITGATPAAITGATPTAITAATPTAITAADPSAALGAFTDPPTAGEMASLRTLINELRTAWIDTKARQAERRTLEVDMIARQAERRTLEIDVKARFAEYLTLITDVKARLAEYRTIVNEIKTDWSGSGTATKANVVIGTYPGQASLFG